MILLNKELLVKRTGNLLKVFAENIDTNKDLESEITAISNQIYYLFVENAESNDEISELEKTSGVTVFPEPDKFNIY